jgi:hypothetical protein
MNSETRWSLILSLLLVVPASTATADTWDVLFDGTDLSAWQSNDGGPPSTGWAIKDGALVRKAKAAYMWTKNRYGDFVLDMEFMTEGNSGVFIRTDDLRNPVQTGIEIQVYQPVDEPTTHTTGALYDLLAPSKCADKPAGQWNHMVITAKDNLITVVLNGEKVIDADLNDWTQAGRNPDGSKNKFKTALKEFKREGHIGLQEHGHMVGFRNIKIRSLDE